MNSFASKIKNIESRLNKLKTLGLSSSSSLAVRGYELSLNFQIVATRTGSGGEVFDTGASQRAYVRLRTKNNSSALTCIRYISPLNVGARILYSQPTLANIQDYNYEYIFYINGDEADRAAIQGGQTLPVQTYKYKILSTSEITGIDIRYEDATIYG